MPNGGTLITFAIVPLIVGAQPPVDVLMSQYNHERTGANLQERILRPANVNAAQFGKIGHWTVDHSQYALPLIATQVNLPNSTRKNLLIAATMANTVYAFDADLPGTAPIWQRNLGTPAPGNTWIGNAPPGTPLAWGILSTPAIDRATGTIYVVAKVATATPGAEVLQINALDLATGNLKFNSPQNMTFPVAGGSTITSGTGSMIQRAGLLVINGVVYVAVADVRINPADVQTQEGYLQSFNAENLSQRYASFQVTPTGLKGGIWQAGRGVTADSLGYVYAATAGGSYNGIDNFGSSVLRFAPQTLALADWFTPSNYDALYHGNIDISANGVTLIPGTLLAFAGGKEGVIYLLNRENMGRLETGSSGPLQRFQASSSCGLSDCAQSLGTAFWSRPGASDSMLYVWDRRDFLRAYTFSNTTLRFTPAVAAVSPLTPELTGGPTVSALDEDPATGIVWGVTTPCCFANVFDANGALTEATLRAYRASDVTQELYNSNTRAADALGFFTKFAPPVVANGKVYVSTHSNKVVAYGLLEPKTLTLTTTGNGTITGTPGGIVCGAASTCTVISDNQSSIQLFATPAAGAAFAGWSNACAGTGVCIVQMTSNASVVAAFAASARITVTKSGAGSGIVSGNGLDCGSTCISDVAIGTAVTLVATPSPGSQFSTWTTGPCAGSANATCAFTLQSNISVNASFAIAIPSTQGYYFLPITPCRAADTRTTSAIAGMTARDFTFIACNMPANAVAVALNVTVVPQTTLGYLSIWPAGQSQPVVSTLNALDGRIKANAAIVGIGVNRAVSIFVTNTAHVVLDVAGYFVPPATFGSLAFYPSPAPCRALDTRVSGGALAALETRPITAAGSGGCLPLQAQAYSLNVTVVPPGPLGFLTLWPDGVTRPEVSTLNALTGTIVANAAIVRSGFGGSLDAFVTNPSHVIADLNGYFAPPGSAGALAFFPVRPCRISDTRNSAGPFGGPAIGALETRDYAIPASACAIPSAARAYVLNATVVPPAPLGYLTLWPGGVSEPPLVSTLNAIDGALTSNLAIVPAGPNGVIRAFAAAATHLLFDISGYFAP